MCWFCSVFRLINRRGFYDNYKTLKVSSIWKSIVLTNVGIVLFYGALASLVGLGTLLVVYLPILIVTSWIGGWLFYIQHQFEDTYWEQNENWDVQEAALLGSFLLCSSQSFAMVYGEYWPSPHSSFV